MKDEDILDVLNNLSEDEMIEKVILPLYRKRFQKKYFNVEFTGKDKREDDGVDITYYEVTPDTETKEYSGVQVKQGEINTGKSANGIASIAIQAQQAFNKRIGDISDKKEYRVQAFTILTTGDILSKARVAIVDQFEHKRIKFVDGKRLCIWIRESFAPEFKKLAESSSVPITEEEEIEPADAIVEYLEEHHESELDEIRATYRTLPALQRMIFVALLERGTSKQFAIAKHIGRSVGAIEDDINNMLAEDVIEVDEDGYSVKEDYEAWQTLIRAAKDRVEALGYSDDLEEDDLTDIILGR